MEFRQCGFVMRAAEADSFFSFQVALCGQCARAIFLVSSLDSVHVPTLNLSRIIRVGPPLLSYVLY